MLNLPARCLLAALGLALLSAPAPAAGPEPDWWQKLEVRGPDNEPVVPAGRWIVLIFISPECPLANASVPVLDALAKDYAPQEFFFVGVYVDPTIPPDALRKHAKEYALPFATADDRAHRLVRATGATYTPEVFVYTRDGIRLYHGRIDDRVEDFGMARPYAVRQNLHEVLAALVAGRTGPFEERRGFGCAIPEPVKK